MVAFVVAFGISEVTSGVTGSTGVSSGGEKNGGSCGISVVEVLFWVLSEILVIV